MLGIPKIGRVAASAPRLRRCAAPTATWSNATGLRKLEHAEKISRHRCAPLFTPGGGRGKADAQPIDAARRRLCRWRLRQAPGRRCLDLEQLDALQYAHR